MQRWCFHLFRFRQNKLVIVNLINLRCDFAMSLFCCFRWLFSKNLFMTLRCKIDCVLSSSFLNVCAFNVFLFIKKSFVFWFSSFLWHQVFFNTFYRRIDDADRMSCVHVNNRILHQLFQMNVYKKNMNFHLQCFCCNRFINVDHLS